MLYRLGADALVVIHGLWVVFVVFGALLAVRWPKVLWAHVPAVLWGGLIEFTGWVCPLTPWENELRRLGGEQGYAGGFIERYVTALVYPEGLTREIQIGLGVGVLVLNAGLYLWVWRRRKGRAEGSGEGRGGGRRVAVVALVAAAVGWGASPLAAAQAGPTGSVAGRVVDASSRRPVAGAEVVARAVGEEGDAGRSLTDADGRFTLAGLPVGVYLLDVTSLGYAPRELTDVEVRSSRATTVAVELDPVAFELEGLAVRPDPFRVPEAAPTSVTVLGAAEIRRAPGGFSDLSRTFLSLPGVTGGVDNRNDLLVRGGGPSENAYVVDGIRIPRINHFATQGAGGGALGLLNVDFVRETELYTGGFPVEYGDALSSVLVVENRPGNPDGIRGDVTLGAAEAGLTLDGPAGASANWLLSVRRSYTQLLFEALDLPIRPDYWDAQLRVEIEPTPRDRVLLLGIGAIDDFDLVEPGPDDDVEDREIYQRVLDNDQRSYTVGASWRRLVGDGFVRATVSRSWTDFRFSDDDAVGEPLIRNRTVEVEERLAVEGRRLLAPGLTVAGGAGAVFGSAESEVLLRETPGSTLPDDLAFGGDAEVSRSWAYARLGWTAARGRLRLVAGLRADEVAALESGFDVSPRISASLDVAPDVTLSAAGGVFVQAPGYLSLAVEEEGEPVNLGLRSPRNVQLVGGLAWRPRSSLRLTVEGFWKDYDRMPVLRDDPRVALVNLGGDYGFVGAEPLTSEGEGRAYGLELFAREKLTDAFYWLAAYTLSWSEFSGADGVLRPSAWDRRHALDLTGGWRPNRRWEVGMKLRALSGLAFTPFDPELSAAAFPVTGRGVPDRDRIGALRTPAYVRLDVRVDRRFSFTGWNGILYLDLQNLTRRENVFGYTWTEDPEFPDGLRPRDGVGFLPTFGFSVEF